MKAKETQILIYALDKIINAKNMLDERLIKLTYSEVMALIRLRMEMKKASNRQNKKIRTNNIATC